MIKKYKYEKGHTPWNKGIKTGKQAEWIIKKRIETK